jgi:C-terminal processing protease CtpA/Prc
MMIAGWQRFDSTRGLTIRELGDGLGYIHVPHFKDDRMVEELGQTLERLWEVRGLILDVRHAYHGEKSVARRMLDRVAPRGQPWTYAVPNEDSPQIRMLASWSRSSNSSSELIGTSQDIA